MGCVGVCMGTRYYILRPTRSVTYLVSEEGSFPLHLIIGQVYIHSEPGSAGSAMKMKKSTSLW